MAQEFHLDIWLLSLHKDVIMTEVLSRLMDVTIKQIWCCDTNCLRDTELLHDTGMLPSHRVETTTYRWHRFGAAKRGGFQKNKVVNVIKVWGRDTGIEGWVDYWKRKLNGVGLIDVVGNYVLLSNQKKAKVQLSLFPATSKCQEKRDKTLNHLSYI